MCDRPIIAQCLEYPIGAFGGIEVLVRALLRGLKNDYRTVLVSDDNQESLNSLGIAPLVDIHIPWNPALASNAAAKELARCLKSNNVTMAHFHAGNYAWGNRIPNRSPIVHVRRSGIPVLSTNHGAFSMLEGYCGSHRPLWMKLALLPVPWIGKVQAVLNVEAEIAVSRNDRAELARWYWPVRNKFRQLYHSNLDSAEPPAPSKGRKKNILCVGTIGDRKGQIYLARAFAEIANQHLDWKLILAGRNGSPEMMSEILRIQNQDALRDRIVLIDSLTDNEIADLMRESAIFAMPSILEGLGLSLQEALFRGCACVGSDVGGIPELIEDGVTGLLVAPRSVPELVNALSRLIADSQLRDLFAESGRASILAKGMTAAQMVRHYKSHYKAILNKYYRVPASSL